MFQQHISETSYNVILIDKPMFEKNFERIHKQDEEWDEKKCH